MKGKKSRSSGGRFSEVDKKDECINPVSKTQEILKLRLSRNHIPSEIFGRQEEKRHLKDLIRRTGLFGESNSVLIIGPRGNGKSALVQKVLVELGEEEDIHTNLLQVHLNGLLQTDDKIALKEITRQLQLENTVGDRVFGSFAETLQFLLEALKSGNQSSKPILFILDEFDLFAQHRNQTLLYNLFDVAQSAQAPICVVGITCRLDVLELLEKRVKSRFSHRQIYLFSNMTFEDYVMLFKELLKLEDDFPDRRFQSDWNKSIEELSEAQSVVDMLKRQFSFSQDVCALKQLLFLPVCNLNEMDVPRLKPAMFVESMKISTSDSKSAMLHGVSILELCLIIAMKHLTDIFEGEPFNFEMVYNEYRKFAQRHSSMQVFHKAVVLKAFEHLVALELVKPVEGGSTKIQKEYRLMSLLLHNTQIMDALQKYPQCPTDVRNWATLSIS
ncbi:hypothetical protein ACJMK2_021857 [Sinanodonta woodiana]|uniref:Origin recognition complex subunit 4 n=1 Tax=Sinanodonta woodiana TaxID=1069815 RepID=A0ABD3THA2_SINWO